MQIKDGLKLAESANASQPSLDHNVAPLDVKQMVRDAAAQIKKQAADRKVEEQRKLDEMQELSNQGSATPVNGKRSI